ncbi:hypothetical protein NKG05_04220 [Oerskovia sp. M15]
MGSALTGLLVLADPMLASMAMGGLLVVLLTTVAGLTLVPALVAAVHRSIPGPQAGPGRDDGRGRGRAARPVGDVRPAPPGRCDRRGDRGAAAPERAAGVPCARELGRTLLPPGTEERVAQEKLEQDFDVLGVQPITLVVDARSRTRRSRRSSTRSTRCRGRGRRAPDGLPGGRDGRGGDP